MRSRVIPGSLVTIDRRVPVRRLKSVDLPTFGRPTMTSDGSLWAMDMDPSRGECAKSRRQCNLSLYRKSGRQSTVESGRPKDKICGSGFELDFAWFGGRNSFLVGAFAGIERLVRAV